MIQVNFILLQSILTAPWFLTDKNENEFLESNGHLNSEKTQLFFLNIPQLNILFSLDFLDFKGTFQLHVMPNILSLVSLYFLFISLHHE